MNNSIVRNVPFTNMKQISSTSTEDWLNAIIELARKDYEIVQGSVVAYSLSKTLRMRPMASEDVDQYINTKDEEIVISKEEIIAESDSEVVETQTGNDLDIDYALIKTFSGDKEKLEAYAIETFKIDLPRNKTFKNMIKELETQLKARE